MIEPGILFAIAPGIVLFVYGIANFSKEMQSVAGERFRSWISRTTKSPLRGALLGAGATALVQSSSATTTIIVGLVNSGIISFAASLGLIIGANAGTTITAQLVALKLTGFGSFFIVFGFLLSMIPGALRFLGKPLFYFGLVFFSLNLISGAIIPLATEPELVQMLTLLDNVFLGILVGFVLTNIIQSSSIITGLVVILSAGGILTLGQGLPLILGASMGTTTTALLSSMGMSLHAKRTAMSHLLMHFIGVLIILPFLEPFESLVTAIGGDGARQIANAHLLFTLSTSLIFLIGIEPFSRIVQAIVPGKEKEILLSTRHLDNGLPESIAEAFTSIEKEIVHSMEVVVDQFDAYFDLLRSPSASRFHRMSKFESLNDYLDLKIGDALLALSSRKLSSSEAERIVLLARISNVIERIGDNAESMTRSFERMQAKGLAFSKEGEAELVGAYSDLRDNLKLISGAFPGAEVQLVRAVRRQSARLEKEVIKGYSHHIQRMKSQKVYSGSAFVDAISSIGSANWKLAEVVSLTREYSRIKIGQDQKAVQ